MKKVLLVLVLLALLVAGAFVYFLSNRGVTDGAELVPAETVAYLAIPDLSRSGQRWKETAIAKIGAEPQVQAFLAGPQKMLGNGAVAEATGILENLKPERFFLAVTGVTESSADVVLGFQYAGGRSDFDAAMKRLDDQLVSMFPDGKKSSSTHDGTTIDAFTSDSFTLFTAAEKNWGFLATSTAAMEGVLDRMNGRDSSESLASAEVFKSTLSHLAVDPDFMWFAKVGPLLDVLLKIGEEAGGVVDPDQLATARKIKALGGTLKFEGPDQKELTFIEMDGMPKLPELSEGMMDLTAADSTAFVESVLDLETISSPEYLASLPPPAQQFFESAGLTGGALKEVLGGEVGVVVKWSPGAYVPAVLLGLTIKDRAKVEAIVTKALVEAGMEMTVSDANGAKVMAFPPMGMQIVDPALAVTDTYFLASLTSSELGRALENKGGTLKDSEAFKPALAAYEGDNQAFGFIDSKTIFESIYNQIRPVIILSASMSPDAAKVINPEKLPETAVMSQHLTPIIYTNRQIDNGWLIESHGPITFSQAGLLIGAGVGVAVYGQMAAGLAN